MSIAALGSLVILIPPKFRNKQELLVIGLILLLLSTWIEKGLSFVIGGFIPNPFGTITQYVPTIPELMISVMIYATGVLILTILWKVAISVKKETGQV